MIGIAAIAVIVFAYIFVFIKSRQRGTKKDHEKPAPEQTQFVHVYELEREVKQIEEARQAWRDKVADKYENGDEYFEHKPIPTPTYIYIYRLIDPSTRKTFYVGQTVDRDARHTQHINNANELGTKKQRYIFHMLERGHKPIMETITTCDSREQAYRVEEFYIREYGVTNSVWGEDIL